MQTPLGSVSGHLIDSDPAVNIAEKRNRAVRTAIDGNYDYLLFIGDDVYPPIETIHRMLLRMRHGAKAVTGVYWTKSIQPEPYIFRGYQRGAFFDWKVGDYIEVDWAGCDCLMLDVASLKAISEPWFSLDYTMSESAEIRDQVGGSGAAAIRAALNTEDLYFYGRWKAAGFKLMCDTSIQCLHEDRTTHALYGLFDGMPQHRTPVAEENEKINGLLIADIGCGNAAQPLYQQNVIHRFDADESCKPDYVCDVRALPVGDDLYDIASASHVLEHLSLNDTVEVLREWGRIVKPGGKLIVAVPDLAYAASVVANDGPFTYDQRWTHPYEIMMLYGSQEHGGMYHKAGFTKTLLLKYAEVALKPSFDLSVEAVTPHGKWPELVLTATKRGSSAILPSVATPYLERGTPSISTGSHS